MVHVNYLVATATPILYQTITAFLSFISGSLILKTVINTLKIKMNEKEKTDLAPMTFPKVTPEIHVTDYLHSKMLDEMIVCV